MKKFVIAILVIVVVVGGYTVLRNLRVSLSILQGETTRARRGDLIVPITASGNIKSASVTRIKGEASGEVMEIPFDVGEMVKKGDLIVRLDETDEQRNFDRADADYKRADFAHKLAGITKQECEEVGVKLAEAKLGQAKARFIRAQSEYDFKQPRTQPSDDLPSIITKEEWDVTLSAYMETEAAVDAADAEKRKAEIAIQKAGLDVDIAEQNKEVAKKALDEAKQRLEETVINSPIDGMILAKLVQVGEMAQSGTASFTGGTVLLEIADVSELYAVVNVDEADIGRVHKLAPAAARPGPTATQPVELDPDTFDKQQQVEVTVESFEDEKFYGVIEKISPQSEVIQAIAMFKVWIRITSNNRNKLIGLLNTQAEARFTSKSVRDAILINYDAYKKNPKGEDYGVFVKVANPEKGQKEYEFRPCKFGADNGEEVEVIEGLQEGEEVYVKLPQMTRKEKRAQEQEGD